MGLAGSYTPVKLFVGVLSTESSVHEQLFEQLQQWYGAIEQITDPVPFTFTDYYNEEMGGEPQRFFIVFSDLIDPSRLASCKMQTQQLEQQYAVFGKRRINLDPGLVSSENVILATTKNRSHRIPLHDGLYGEVTLLYRDRTFQALPWTYADYASPAGISFFCNVRKNYREQLKQES
jgi:hypothetical protein